jgi:lysozyme family protein
MGSDFKIAVAKTLVNEGGYVNDPADPGGATNMGIEQREWPDGDIKDITQEQAMALYAERYWKDLYSQIESQDVADKLFDMGVLFGVGTAVRILQLSVEITVDGAFGPNTLAAVNQADAVSLLQTYKANLVTHAFNLATTNPALRKFVAGWGRRVNS